MRKTVFLFALLLAASFLGAVPVKAQNSQSVYPSQYQQPQYQQYPNRNYPVHYPAATTTYTSQPSYTGNYRQVQPAPIYNNNGVGQLPSYTYDPNLDVRREAYRAPDPNDPPMSSSRNRPYMMSLESFTGIDINGQLTYYKYEEPSINVSDTGALFGLNIVGTYNYAGFWAAIDGRWAYGQPDYEGSGTLESTPVTTWEWRGLFGKDLIYDTFAIAPYIGFGYRTLYNDVRGTTSTGAAGYRRYNELYYLPIGVHPRAHIDSTSRISSTLELDVLLHGLQKSDLSDAGLGDPNVKNGQSSGYGLRGDIMYETRSWSIGPYFSYWSIDDSKTKYFNDNSASTCAQLGTTPPCVVSGLEPANDTIEAGLQIRYHLF